jgi:hypothetical protein
MNDKATNQVSILLDLMDSAFDGPGWDSLLGNLQSTTPDDWEWVPEGGSRSIRDIVRHVGGCKFMYENYAFGDGSLTWSDPLVDGATFTTDLEAASIWLREGQLRLRVATAALSDADLRKAVPVNWGGMASAFYVISMMIHHDVYHAGEINLLRSLRNRDDRWAYDR